MQFSVIIPARYASTRLPAKPLANIAGKTMIQRVYEQAALSGAEQVVVATDHKDIEQAVTAFGGQVCFTREDHASGTDRLAEVVEKLNLADDALVVNVQGDEPLIPPAVINQVADNLARCPEASVATVSEPITELDVYLDPNAVKVLRSDTGNALYFSRAPIPWNRDLLADTDKHAAQLDTFLASGSVQKHIGIYAYKVSLLKQFVTWPVSMLENTEKLEQLRVLANDHRIHVDQAVEAVPGGVDTLDDLEKINRYFQELGA
jgi:3-deoxy-manno-octulosonate cytidylyltransferase (CMP-KDO synthetase)